MKNNFIGNKISVGIGHIIGIISSNAISVLIEYVFHKFQYTILFIILIILSILIYLLTKKHLTNVTIRNWKKTSKYSLFFSIAILFFLLFFSMEHVTTTKNRFTYIKGTVYTHEALCAKCKDLINDNDLIDSFSENVGMVYTDFAFYNRIFSISLIFLVISIDITLCCDLKLKSMKRKTKN